MSFSSEGHICLFWFNYLEKLILSWRDIQRSVFVLGLVEKEPIRDTSLLVSSFAFNKLQWVDYNSSRVYNLRILGENVQNTQTWFNVVQESRQVTTRNTVISFSRFLRYHYRKAVWHSPAVQHGSVQLTDQGVPAWSPAKGRPDVLGSRLELFGFPWDLIYRMWLTRYNILRYLFVYISSLTPIFLSESNSKWWLYLKTISRI